MEVIIMIAQLILGISILVGVHELGHHLAAKSFGMRVEQFSIGFPPKIFGVKWRGTEYRLGSIPLGGYVKISGMIDESLDKKHLNAKPEHWEFRSKPAWQRLIVMMSGILVNVFTGIIIYSILTYSYGEKSLLKEEVNKYGIVPNDLGEELGFRTGDKIISINGKDFERFKEIMNASVLLADYSYYTVLRNGKKVDIPLPSNLMSLLSDNDMKLFVEPIQPFKIARVQAGSGAAKGGLNAGDQIIEVAGEKVAYYHEFKKAVYGKVGETVSVTVLRNGSKKSLEIAIDENGLMGFMPEMLLEISTVNYPLPESFIIGTEKAFATVWVHILAFGKIFKGDMDPTKSLQGPIGIAKIFGGTWNWLRFWNLVGILSMILAFMNFLPIPALDGGHVMFLTYEIVTGRKPSDKFLENAQRAGMAVLIALMIFVFANDIIKLF